MDASSQFRRHTSLVPPRRTAPSTTHPRARGRLSVFAIPLLLLAPSCPAPGQNYQDFITATPLPPNDTLVVGFMGGREPWNNDKRWVRKLALKLRAVNVPGVHVETVENTRRQLAIELIKNGFDRNRDRTLDSAELGSARLIVYGHSFGGAAVVKLAHELEEIDLPILLTVQIDSVGRGDGLIPPNVRQAANLFQPNGLVIRGEPEIRAQDPSRTTIVGNFEYDYRDKNIDLSHVSWWKKLFRTAHTKMGHDPEVWAKVEGLILRAVAEAPAARSQRTAVSRTEKGQTKSRPARPRSAKRIVD